MISAALKKIIYIFMALLLCIWIFSNANFDNLMIELDVIDFAYGLKRTRIQGISNTVICTAPGLNPKTFQKKDKKNKEKN